MLLDPLVLMRVLLRERMGQCRPLRPQAASGISCPEGLLAIVRNNGFHADEGTIADGNCGLHAFAISAFAAAQHDAQLRTRNLYKSMHKLKADVPKLVLFLRKLAVKWLKENKQTPASEA